MSADRALEPFELPGKRLLVDGVDLRQADDLGLLLEALAIGRELATDGAVVGAGVGPGRIDEMDERAAALDMAEEAVAEAVAFMRALDEAGNVGEDEIAPVDADDAKAGMEGGEGVVGDFRLGGRDGGEKGRLSRVGQADEARVRDQFEAQDQRPLDSGLSGIGAARGAVGGGGEMGVAETAVAALAPPRRAVLRW